MTTPQTTDEFQYHRNQIDTIDQTLLKLLNQRAHHAQAIGAIKQKMGDTEMYRPEREAQILSKHIQNNTGPIENHEIARLFREIMSVCLALEKPLNIAFLGPIGTFTEQAVFKHFGGSAKTTPQKTINDVFREVEAENADFGVVPIENSTEGMVNLTLDTFIGSSLTICGETHLRIHQNLIGMNPNLNEITEIYSHPQSLAQCRNWLDQHLPNAKQIAVNSNAEAVAISKQKLNSASIAGQSAAEHFEVPILFHNIEDDPLNTTRFLIIGRKTVPASGHDKTSLLVSSNDRPGLLLHLIEPLAKYDVTMTRIESRPSKKGVWRYVFFMDIMGHQDEPNVASALAEIKQEASLFKVLGSYPIARF